MQTLRSTPFPCAKGNLQIVLTHFLPDFSHRQRHAPFSEGPSYPSLFSSAKESYDFRLLRFARRYTLLISTFSPLCFPKELPLFLHKKTGRSATLLFIHSKRTQESSNVFSFFSSLSGIFREAGTSVRIISSSTFLVQSLSISELLRFLQRMAASKPTC